MQRIACFPALLQGRNVLILRWTARCLLTLLATLSLAVQAETRVVYIHTDALGSVVAKSDSNGQVIERFDYEPFGAVMGGGVEDAPGYTGHVFDGSTGLSYMQQRYMDPQLGLFLSVDPVAADTVDQRLFNRYTYAFNNPYRFTDPDGRAPHEPRGQEQPPPQEMERVTVTADKPDAQTSRPSNASVVTLSTVLVQRAAPAALALSSTAAAAVAAPFLLFAAPHPCGGRRCGELTEESRRHAPGVWPADKGSEEWGRRNGVGANEGRRRFHDIKQNDKGQGGGKGADNYGANPSTGDVVNPQGEVVGNLGES